MKRRAVVLGGLGIVGSALPVTAFTQTPTDAEQANIDTVHRFMEMLNTNDVSIVPEVISPDYVSADPSNAPGVDAYIDRLTTSFDQQAHLWTSLESTEEEIIAQGNNVVRLGRYKGVTTTGKVADVPDVRWFKLTDGLITIWYGGPDSGWINRQVG